MTTQTRIPTSDGSCAWGHWSGNYNYLMVDSYPSIDDSNYNIVEENYQYDLFGFLPFTIPIGATIQNVTVYVRGLSNASPSAADLGPALDIADVKYQTLLSGWTTSFSEKSYVWTINPNTGQVWTVDDVNGVGSTYIFRFGYVDGSAVSTAREVSRVYIEVNYTGGSSSPTNDELMKGLRWWNNGSDQGFWLGSR